MRQILLYVLLLFVGSVSAEQFKITGKVVDAENHEPLIGTTVQIKGTDPDRRTAADIDGNFSIEVEKGAILRFSYVGYYSKEVEVLNDSSLVIELRDNGTRPEEILYAVKGKVTDKYNNPLIGAAVEIKGAGAQPHTTTDIDGNFCIPAGKGQIIRFTCVGYYSREVEVLNDSSLVIELEEDESDTSDDFNYMIGQGPSLCPCPHHTAIRERIKQNQNNLKRNLQEAVINRVSSTLTNGETVEYLGHSGDKYIKVDGAHCFSTNVSYDVVLPNGAKEKHSAHVVTNDDRDKIIEWKDI